MHAMGREGLVKIGMVRQLPVTRNVIIRAGENPDAGAMRFLGQLAELRYDLIGFGNVELPVRPHEIVLCINIPEQRASHHFPIGTRLQAALQRGAR